MSAHKLTEFLDEHQVRYTTITHSPAFTAQEIAHAAHIPGSEMAKTVMVRLDGRLVEVILPATQRLDLERFRKATGARKAELAKEDDFDRFFPDCEVGAMPACGNLYGMEVYVSQQLSEDRQIAFNAGNHSELICMKCADFKRLVHPVTLPLTG
jgi:Ala-tRNA(Pro) deacylase